jgi:UDP-N-acetylmuramoyl-L-alanyl-D-glutamate--2,6-diaminopimelate ligase
MIFGAFTKGSATSIMTLDQLVRGASGVQVIRGGDRTVEGVRIDSRGVEPGDLFVAIAGQNVDGARFVQEALSRGAVGCLTARGAESPDSGAWLVAEEPRRVVGPLASQAWGQPSQGLPVVGITGTNGKTTTSFLLQSIVEAIPSRAAVFGTLGSFLPNGPMPQSRTTPEAPDLQEGLAIALEQGAELAILEVSSHALDLYRVDGTSFAVAVFLNLTPEHLDWHGTMESYARSKARLFTDLLASGSASRGPRALIHANDPWAGHFREVVEEAFLFAVGRDDVDVTARGFEPTAEGTSFTLVTPSGAERVNLRLPGEYNVTNALAAASAAYVLGYTTETIARGLSRASAPAGRFERVHHGSFDAYVDYAHTPDGLRRSLQVARERTPGRVIVVLGCGGNRDREKRPVMGRLAAELADVAIFTTDNPRNEDPSEIIQEMLEGAGDRRTQVAVVLDREEALGWAVDSARAGDLVLAVGKGHETYQAIRGKDLPFPEREILARLARRRDGDGR